ncbi:MAG: tRNA pseudouridine(55) synthase TruB [Alphaproteobacteria bacterium]|nr:tRNA pseudouridine(55) synthase TruB [Alphaproteobacteria bacterium]
MKPSDFWIVIDKPLGMSSNHALGKVKRLFGIKKAGFSGTLDPLATGVLPIAFNQALKTMHYMTFSKKAYTFQIRFGQSTTTEDAEGDVTETSEVRPSRHDIINVLEHFKGAIEQVPPAYSALKVDGKRAYDLARKGEIVELKKRAVRIEELTLLSVDDDDHATFHVTCTAGTYVRSLARDLAIALDTKGHVSMLRRTQAGCFFERDAITLEKCAELVHNDAIIACMHSMGIGLDDILAVPITQCIYATFKLGQKVSYTPPYPLEDSSTVGLWLEGAFAGFAVYEAGELSPKRMINFLD